MTSEILINVGAGETRIALAEDGVLQAYVSAPAFAGGARPGDIYNGRVTRVAAAMQAAFVDIGQARDGFLSLRDAPTLHEGAAVAVQVTREAMGEKGAKLTARIALTPEVEVHRRIAKPPVLLQAGPGPIERALAAWKADRVLTDDARTAQNLKLELVGDDLIARHDLEEQIAILRQSRVTLHSGGWITIEKTEGLTAIDVNSGSFAASGGRAETARVVNLEAARAAGRQVRMRGIGGLIVVDFIQMDEGAGAVTAALQAELARDPAAADVLPMNSHGIVSIARQRRDAPLARWGDITVIANDILRAMERATRAVPGREIMVRAAPDVVAWLDRPEIRGGLDRRGVGRVRYIAEARRREDYDVGS